MRPHPAIRGARPAAFTLLEICIGVMIILAAVPSISGVLQDQRAKKRFDQFNDLVSQASFHAVAERRPYILEWDDSGVTLRPLEPKDPGEARGIGRVDFGDKLAPDLQLPGALDKDPPREWTFWPTGTCEPANIVCRIADAPWTASYDALTEQPYYTSP